MRADRAKQLLKNGVYRAIGETVSGVGALDGEQERTLRVLMYHKVNDLWPNPTTVPTARLRRADGAAPRARLRAGRRSTRCATTTCTGRRFRTARCSSPSTTATATTSRTRSRSCSGTAIPAVVFVPIAFLDDSRPLPHEEPLRLLGVRNETVDWAELAALEAGGIRIESHGIGHRPLSDLDPAEATREIAISKLRLEERLGREVEAYAFVKGSLADYRPEHASLVQQAGYKLAFTSVSGANGPGSDRFRLRRYNVEPYPRAHVRARPRRGVRPDRGQGHGRRLARPAGVQRRPRDRFAVELRDSSAQHGRTGARDLVALLARVGTTQLSDEEFSWWFERNPAGEGIVSLAVDGGDVVGVAAMSFFRTVLDGSVTRLAIPVNVATDPRYRGQGVFSTLEQENEAAAAATGAPLTVTFPNGASYPIFVNRLGWVDLPRLRLWARPLRARRRGPLRARAARERRRAAGPEAAAHAYAGSRCAPSTRSARISTSSAGRRQPATGATSSATRSTSTGATSTRRATTAA